MKSKFKFYEIVKVVGYNERIKKIFGREGPITGKSQTDDGNGKWAYAIDFPEATWFVFEDELESSGKYADPKKYYTGESIKVGVRPDGTGYLKEPQDPFD